MILISSLCRKLLPDYVELRGSIRRVDGFGENKSKLVNSAAWAPIKANNSISVGEGFEMIVTSTTSEMRGFGPSIGNKSHTIDSITTSILYLSNILTSRHLPFSWSSSASSLSWSIDFLNTITQQHLKIINVSSVSDNKLKSINCCWVNIKFERRTSVSSISFGASLSNSSWRWLWFIRSWFPTI